MSFSGRITHVMRISVGALCALPLSASPAPHETCRHSRIYGMPMIRKVRRVFSAFWDSWRMHVNEDVCQCQCMTILRSKVHRCSSLNVSGELVVGISVTITADHGGHISKTWTI